MPPNFRSPRRFVGVAGIVALCVSVGGLAMAQDAPSGPRSQQDQQAPPPATPGLALDAQAQEQALEQALEGLDQTASKVGALDDGELRQARPEVEASLQRLELALIQGVGAGPARYTAARDAIDAARASLRADDADREDLAAALRKVIAEVKDARAQPTAPGAPGAAQPVVTSPEPPETELRPLDREQPQTTGALLQREGENGAVAPPPVQERAVAEMGAKLVGMQVVGADNAYIASVADVAMDGDRASAVILRIGGFLGLGARSIAIPVEQLRLDDNRLMSTLTESEARALPAYNP